MACRCLKHVDYDSHDYGDKPDNLQTMLTEDQKVASPDSQFSSRASSTLDARSSISPSSSSDQHSSPPFSPRTPLYSPHDHHTIPSPRWRTLGQSSIDDQDASRDTRRTTSPDSGIYNWTSMSSPRSSCTISPPSTAPSSPRLDRIISSPRMLSPRSSGSKKEYVKFVIPRTSESRLSVRDVEFGAVNKLKMAMIQRDSHKHIPLIISEWPCTQLRLSAILSQEACVKVFTSPDKLWALILHGLLIQTPTCRLRCLDLSHYEPSKALIYTMLQLIPLFSYKDHLCKDTILKHITQTHNVKDRDLLFNLNKFLDTILRHPVYSKGQKLHNGGPLEIMIDFLPLAADKLSFYCWLMSSSLYSVTNVQIRINSAVFTYAEVGSEFTLIDPLLPLAIFINSSCVQDLQGLSVNDVPANHMHKLISLNLVKCAERGHMLRHLAINGLDISTDFTQQHLQSQFRFLVLQSSGLTRLDISGARVSGLLGMALTSATIRLEYLNLRRSCLDDSDIMAVFDNLTNLRELNMSLIYSSNCEYCTENRSPTEAYKGTVEAITDTKDTNNNPHTNDIDMLQIAFNNIHKMRYLQLLDIRSDKFGSHRVDKDSLDTLMNSIQNLPLVQLNIKLLPLWDKDIFSVIHTLSSMSSLRSVSMTRSDETDTLTIQDRFVFWNRVEHMKNGKRFRVNVDNLVDESLYNSDPDDSDDNS